MYFHTVEAVWKFAVCSSLPAETMGIAVFWQGFKTSWECLGTFMDKRVFLYVTHFYYQNEVSFRKYCKSMTLEWLWIGRDL